MNKQVQSLVRDERGANMVEYIILVGVVALLAIVGFKFFGQAVDSEITEQAGKVTEITQ